MEAAAVPVAATLDVAEPVTEEQAFLEDVATVVATAATTLVAEEHFFLEELVATAATAVTG